MDTDPTEPTMFDATTLTDAQMGNLALHGKSWANLFWPGRAIDPTLSKRLRFDEVDDLFHHRVRYMPTAKNVAAASMYFGEKAQPLLTEWRKLWMDSLDVDAFDLDRTRKLLEASDEQERGAPPIGGHLTRSSLLDDAHYWARMDKRRKAAGLFAQAECWRNDEPKLASPRDKAQHIVEDALSVVALARAGVPFSASTFGFMPTTFVFRDGTFREIDIDTDDDETAALNESISRTFGAANPYWISRAFRDSAGRRMCVTRGVPELTMTLLDMRAQGHRKAFLKSVRSKGGTWVIPLAGVTTYDEMELRLHATLGRRYAGLMSGDPMEDAFLVQEFVPFAKEHRFFVVGDRIVASTASDRALSVFDIRVRILDDRIAVLDVPASETESGAYDRGSSTSPVDRALVARMAREARRIVRSLRDEGVVGDCYVLDMGVTVRSIEEGEEEVLPIEINTLLYAGLYAADWNRVADALGRRKDRERRLPAGGTVVGVVGTEWSAAPNAGGGFTVSATKKPHPIVDRILSKVGGKRRDPVKEKDADRSAADISLLLSRMHGMLEVASKGPTSMDD